MSFIENKKKPKSKNWNAYDYIKDKIEDILSKPQEEVNAQDIDNLQRQMFWVKIPVLDDIIQQYYDMRYGSETAPKDEFGRMSFVGVKDNNDSAIQSFVKNLWQLKDEGLEEECEDSKNKPIKEQKYIWQGERGCGDCSEYDGMEFDESNIPYTHPNCKCDIIIKDSQKKAPNPMPDNRKQKKEEEKKTSKYELGSLSAEFESNNKSDAIGYDTKGGHSYGNYQIETKQGTMKDYIKYVEKNPKYEKIGKELQQSGGYEGALNKTKEFEEKWKELSKDKNFEQSQKDFIIDKKLEPVLEKVQDIKGLDLQNRHPVVKDVIYSTAVQHGDDGAPNLLHNALGKDASKMSDKEIIDKVYQERGNVEKYFKSSPHLHKSIKDRFENENRKANDFLE